ncbi:MAG: hypothetical protein WCW33_00580 [Candidatus Babeliales bacterium]|jgi:hypothetical protein
MNVKIIHNAFYASIVFFALPSLNAMLIEPISFVSSQGAAQCIHASGLGDRLDASICDRLYAYSKLLNPQIVKLPDVKTLQARFKIFVSPEKDKLEYTAANKLAQFLDAKDMKFSRVMVAVEMTVDAIINEVIAQNSYSADDIDGEGLTTQYIMLFLATIFAGDDSKAQSALESYMQISGISSEAK